MQPPKLIRIAVTVLLLSTATFAAPSYAQSPVVVSASNAPLVFELPSTSNLSQQLHPYTTAKLATPAQHLERGLAYPLWLSDANFTVKARSGQRTSVVVEAKRGNPDLATDLLLAINNKGLRSLQPSTLIFDKTHTFASASPMPAADQATQPDLASGFASALKSAKPLDFSAVAQEPKKLEPQKIAPQNAALAEQGLRQAQPERESERKRIENRAHVRPTQTSRMNVTKPSAATSPATLPAPAPITFPASVASQATLDKASQPSTPAAQTPSGLPTRPPPKPPKPLPEPSWLDDWPLLAGAATGLLLLAYLVIRLLKKRTKPVDFQYTRSPAEQATNTVFGLSAEEAEAMHKKWLSDQLLSKNNK